MSFEPAGTYLEALSLVNDVQLRRLESSVVKATALLIAGHIEACGRNIDDSAGHSCQHIRPIEYESEYNNLYRQLFVNSEHNE